jgi:hypothetical protein
MARQEEMRAAAEAAAVAAAAQPPPAAGGGSGGPKQPKSRSLSQGAVGSPTLQAPEAAQVPAAAAAAEQPHPSAFRLVPEAAVPFPPNLTAQTHLVLYSPALDDEQRLAPVLQARGAAAAAGAGAGPLVRVLPTAPPTWAFSPAPADGAPEAGMLASVCPLPAGSPTRPFYALESLRVAETRQIASMCVPGALLPPRRRPLRPHSLPTPPPPPPSPSLIALFARAQLQVHDCHCGDWRG